MAQTDPTHFIIGLTTNDLTALNTIFPPGTYLFDVSGQATSVNFAPGSALPNPPQLTNFDAAQGIDPTKDFELQWAPFTITGGVLNFITAEIFDPNGTTVLKAPDPGCPGALEQTSTSLVIPANTLTTNQAYRLSLVFIHATLLDTNSTPNVAMIAGTESQTSITIRTGAGSGGTPPSSLVLTNAAWLPTGAIRFDLTTTPGTAYTIQFNADLSQTTGWTPLLSTNASASLLSFTNSPPSGTKAGFYRAFHN
jgi:hypothetical protein